MKELIIMLQLSDKGVNHLVDIAKGKYESTTFWTDVKRGVKNKLNK